MEVGREAWVYYEKDWERAEILAVFDGGAQYQVRTISQKRHVTVAAQEVLAFDEGETAFSPDDLGDLVHLHEASILRAVESRFQQNKVYTSTGAVLLAVNPYQTMPELYNQKTLQQYVERGKDVHNNIHRTGTTPPPPHVYAVADQAFRDLQQQRQNQTILVGGESGAGKTETTKIVMKYLSVVAEKHNQNTHSDPMEDVDPSEPHEEEEDADYECTKNRVLESNPILEAFGNAKTILNSNSSRFGKFIRIGFCRNSGVMLGAEISIYLLERVRLVSQAFGERNFHIFYELLQGSSTKEKEALYLSKESYQKAQDFAYLNSSNCYTREDNVDDTKQYLHTRHAMSTLGMCLEEQMNVLQIVSSILHLGNLTFVSSTFDESSYFDQSCDYSIEAICTLLGISRKDLESCICSKKIKAGMEFVCVSLGIDKAKNSRDALAKTIYAKLFDWLVARINQSISYEIAADNGFIGVIDIFGFEIFPENYLEQLCINFANEKLQQVFTNWAFTKELQEYEFENIVMNESLLSMSTTGNAACIDLFEKRPLGLFALIDEQSLVPKGSDKKLANKLYDLFATNHDTFSFTKIQKVKRKFNIHHYADKVCYTINGFYEKNSEFGQLETTLQLMETCSNFFMRNLFRDNNILPRNTTKIMNKDGTNGVHMRNTDTNPMSVQTTSIPNVIRSFSNALTTSDTPNGSINSSIRSRRKGSNGILSCTVVTQFKNQLNSLLELINSTQPHFIRCFKPNDERNPILFNRLRVLQQLKCSGVIEAVRVSRFGYPVRYDHSFFLSQYGHLTKTGRTVQEVMVYLTAMIVKSGGKDYEIRNCDQPSYQIGKTKIFLTKEIHLEMESILATYYQKYVALLQRSIRGFLVRLQYVRLLTATKCIQHSIRQYFQRRNKMLRGILLLQAHARGCLVRRDLAIQINQVVIIQKYTRCFLGRMKYSIEIKKRKESLRIQNDLILLEKQRQQSIAAEIEAKKDEELVDRDSSSVSTTRGSSITMAHGSSEYIITWESGLLGLYFESDDVNGLPVVKRIHESLSSCRDIHRVNAGDTLIAVGPDKIQSDDGIHQTLTLLQKVSKPVKLHFLKCDEVRSSKFRKSSIESLGMDEYEVLWKENMPLGLGLKPHPKRKVPCISRHTGNANLPGMSNVVIGDLLMYIDEFACKDIAFKKVIEILEKGPRPMVLRFARGSNSSKSVLRNSVDSPYTNRSKSPVHKYTPSDISTKVEDSLYHVTWRDEDGPLGIVVKQASTSYYPTVTKINNVGIASKKGVNVLVGDMLLCINNHNINQLRFRGAMELLKNGPKPLLLTFQRRKAVVSTSSRMNSSMLLDSSSTPPPLAPPLSVSVSSSVLGTPSGIPNTPV